MERVEARLEGLSFKFGPMNIELVGLIGADFLGSYLARANV